MSSKVTINGKTIKVDGNGSVAIIGETVYIDGKPVDLDSEGVKRASVYNIEVVGSVQSVSTTSGNITVNGDAASVSSHAGDIAVKGNVNGDARTTAGDVKIGGSVGGNVATVAGDIKYRR